MTYALRIETHDEDAEPVERQVAESIDLTNRIHGTALVRGDFTLNRWAEADRGVVVWEYRTAGTEGGA